MKTILKSLAMAFLLCAGSSLMAQDNAEMAADKAQGGPSDAENAAWEKAMAVGPMHKLLASGAGEWKTDMKMWMAPNAEPQTSTGSCMNEMILGGRYQESKYESSVMGMPYEGRGLVGYDNLKNMFVNTWSDNMGTGIMYSEGPYDEKTNSITFKGSYIDPMTGKEVKTREVYKFVADNHHIFEMYATQEGKEFKSMEINYRR